MNITDFVPPRRLEDILAQRVRLLIDGEVYDLAALSIEATEAWVREMDAYILSLFGAIDGTEIPGEVITQLSAQSDELLTLLIAYDARNVLPDRDRLRERMTPLDLLVAVLEVWRAANPLVDAGLDMMTLARRMTILAGPTSSQRLSTDGPPRSSGAH